MPLPRTLGRFNKAVTNHVTGLFAGRLPGFGIIAHRGRRSGRTYHTPVNVFRRPGGGLILALTYGRADWVENVLTAGQATIRMQGRAYDVRNPRLVTDPTRAGLPAPVRAVLGLLRVDQLLYLDDGAAP
jgi:deazaflavin-dependent oxidoreductase (nitroreductase family)